MMKQTKQWLGEIFLVSLITNLFFFVLYYQIPIFRLAESKMLDNLLKIRSSSMSVEDVPVEVVGIDSLNLSKIEESRERYCQLIEFLLMKANAKVLVLNLPRIFVFQSDDSQRCLKKSIKKEIVKQLVLVSYTEPFINDPTPVISDYHYLMPFDLELMTHKKIPLNTVGFFEYYQDNLRELPIIDSPARRISLQGQFYDRRPDQTINIESALLLTIEKFTDSSNIEIEKAKKKFKQVIFQYFGPTGTFKSTGIQEICPQIDYCNDSEAIIKRFKDKIIVVGLTEQNNLIESSLPMISIWGEPMSTVEIQANIISSFLTDNFYFFSPQWLNILIIVTGGFIINYSVACGVNQKVYFHLLITLLILIVFDYILNSYLFFLGFIFPLVASPIIWIGTAILGLSYFKFRQKQRCVKQKLQELERYKKAEKEAILLCAERLLRRVATDIHDGPLQELKLVMDNLEEILFTKEYEQINDILDRLADTGKQIRLELYSTTQLANKMDITQQLKEGLSTGIKITLNELIITEQLKLKLIDQIETLEEPYFNSDWISFREDIFRFFKEALNNVIKYAQPPFGSASTVKVFLQQQDNYCILEIENDGQNNLNPTSDSYSIKSGGYGTKIMTTIAEELPEGEWHREFLPTGETQVYLRWNMNSFIN